MMHKRHITVGTLLGVGLLGTLIAMAQESEMPRPRPVAPPPMSENEPLPIPEKPTLPPTLPPVLPPITPPAVSPTVPTTLPELPTMPKETPLPEPKAPLMPIQFVEPKVSPLIEPKGIAAPVVEPKMAPPPALLDVPVAPLPPVAPTKDTSPPPLAPPVMPPVMPPVVVPEMPPAVVPEIKPPVKVAPAPISAAPQPWSPNDTPRTEIKPPDLLRTPIETIPQNPPPSVPVNNPNPGQSRFVVTPRSTQPAQIPPLETSPPPPQPAAAPQGHGIPYFQPVRKPSIANKPAPQPIKIHEMSRPIGPEITQPLPSSALGTLTPQLTVEKRGPLFHKVGGPLKYQIVVRNVGAITAQSVRVEDDIPGSKLVGASPEVAQLQGERLVWLLPSLRPGEERILTEDLQPVRAGDVVSMTSVHVYASTSFRTRLDGEVPPPPPNTLDPHLYGGGGSTPPIPKIITIPDPAKPQPPVDNKAPVVGGPILQLDPPAPPGKMPMTVEVKALPIVELGKKLTFEIIVVNTSKAPLTGMMLYGKIPAGFLHPEGDTIGADLPDMAAGETKVYKMPVTAIAPGKHVVEVRVTAAPNFELVASPVITVDGGRGPALQPSANPGKQPGADIKTDARSSPQSDAPASLQVQIKDRDDPLEKGKETVYAVRITNIGSTLATNVRAVISLSEGLEPSGFAQAPTAYTMSGRDIVFNPIPRLQPGATATIHLSARGSATGSQNVRVQVVSDQARAPIARDEQTQVRDK